MRRLDKDRSRSLPKRRSKGDDMYHIRHELAGYRLPAYVEEILTRNYCPGFLKMSMVREREAYNFSYRPGVYKKLDHCEMSLYEKLILIKSLISLSEKNKEHLIYPESYLIEPELIYLKDNNASCRDVKIMYYPDIKALSFRYKLVLFAARILNKKLKEEREAMDQISMAAESGDINRIKLSLEKQIMRCEKRMEEGKILS